jgi:hypothetical protein
MCRRKNPNQLRPGGTPLQLTCNYHYKDIINFLTLPRFRAKIFYFFSKKLISNYLRNIFFWERPAISGLCIRWNLLLARWNRDLARVKVFFVGSNGLCKRRNLLLASVNSLLARWNRDLASVKLFFVRNNGLCKRRNLLLARVNWLLLKLLDTFWG